MVSPAVLLTWKESLVYPYGGEPDLAIQWLERAHEQHESGLPCVKSLFTDALGGDPRRRPLRAKVGPPE